MQRPSDLSISETGTLQTDVSSCNSNDDTQSSIGISFDDAVIDNIIAQIPDTPTTRKSVTWFPDPVKAENPPTFLAANALRPISERVYEPSENGTFPGFDDEKVSELPAKPSGRLRSSTSICREEGNNSDEFLLNGGRLSISHRPSIVSHNQIEDISYCRVHYMKIWLIALLSAITLFVLGLLLLPSSVAPPLFPLIETTTHIVRKHTESLTIHVNKTTRDIYITEHKDHDIFSTDRYSQSFAYLGNSSLPFKFSQSRKCSKVVDENVVCCEDLNFQECHIKRGHKFSTYKVDADPVIDAEFYKGKLYILEVIKDENKFVIDNGRVNRTVRVPAGEIYQFKQAFLQNGTLFSFYEHRTHCAMQLLCMETECGEIRQSSCGMERIFPAVAGNSMVLMHCQDETTPIAGLHGPSSCTLSQLLFPSLATIARSVPFEHTRSSTKDQLETGFGDYIDPSVFHLNRLHQKNWGEWEVEISTYRLLSIS